MVFLAGTHVTHYRENNSSAAPFELAVWEGPRYSAWKCSCKCLWLEIREINSVLSIVVVEVTPFLQNTRVIFDIDSNCATLVDPGGEPNVIYDVVQALGVTELEILLTHAHIDHAGGVAGFSRLWQEQTGNSPKLYGHSIEKEMRSTIAQQAIIFGLPASEYENAPEPDRYVDDGDEMPIAGRQGDVLFTPGHAPGHISVFLKSSSMRFGVWDRNQQAVGDWTEAEAPLLIAGDTVFAGSIGRTDLPGGDHQLLLQSIREKIMALPDDTVILPGHGPNTSVGVERSTNPFLQ